MTHVTSTKLTDTEKNLISGLLSAISVDYKRMIESEYIAPQVKHGLQLAVDQIELYKRGELPFDVQSNEKSKIVGVLCLDQGDYTDYLKYSRKSGCQYRPITSVADIRGIKFDEVVSTPYYASNPAMGDIQNELWKRECDLNNAHIEEGIGVHIDSHSFLTTEMQLTTHNCGMEVPKLTLIGKTWLAKEVIDYLENKGKGKYLIIDYQKYALYAIEYDREVYNLQRGAVVEIKAERIEK